MNSTLKLSYEVCGDDFTTAGETSSTVKKTLSSLGIAPEIIRRVAISMYEGEINMVIHANGGTIDVLINPEKITIVLEDKGPGISDVEMAMREGYSTASDKIRELGFGAGMGLPNMKKYSDEMFIDSKPGEGTKVTLIIKIN